MKEQAQQAKESWHTRIHRRPTETELHRKVAGKTAQSIIDAALNRCAFFSCVRHHNTKTTPQCYLGVLRTFKNWFRYVCAALIVYSYTGGLDPPHPPCTMVGVKYILVEIFRCTPTNGVQHLFNVATRIFSRPHCAKGGGRWVPVTCVATVSSGGGARSCCTKGTRCIKHSSREDDNNPQSPHRDTVHRQRLPESEGGG